MLTGPGRVVFRLDCVDLPSGTTQDQWHVFTPGQTVQIIEDLKLLKTISDDSSREISNG